MKRLEILDKFFDFHIIPMMYRFWDGYTCFSKVCRFAKMGICNQKTFLIWKVNGFFGQKLKIDLLKEQLEQTL